MADEKDKELPPAGEEEAVEGEEQSKPRFRLKIPKAVLFGAGVFLLSATVVNVAMFFYFQKLRNPQVGPMEAALEQAAAETTAVVDSLLEQDSLDIVVDELVTHIIEKNIELDSLRDSTQIMATRLEELQGQLASMDQREVDLGDGDVARLARVFGSMRPNKAAPVMMKMDDAAVAGILLEIEERTAAKILAAMPAEKAAAIARLIRTKAREKQLQRGN